MAEDKQMECSSAEQFTKNCKAYGLEDSILEKRQSVVSERSQVVGLVDRGNQPCSEIVDDKAHMSKSFEIKRMGVPSENPCQLMNLAASPENVINNTKNAEIASAGEDIGESIHKFDSEFIVHAHSLKERRCQLGVEGSTIMPSSHEQLHASYENLNLENRMLPSPNITISDEAGSILCPYHHEFHETQSGSLGNQLPGPDHVVNVSVQLQVHIGELANGSSYYPSELQQENLTRNSRGSGHRGKRTSKRLKKINTLKSSLGSDRVLRSRSKDKSIAESNDDEVNPCTGEEVKRKQRKKRRATEAIVDEFSRIRKNLSYMLNRIGYERSLIDAYSGEGWKGLSLEKIKPEKELQRATSEIIKRKLRIRDLFQRLDSLCAEGKLPEALFDSEGMIDSEDIFCAKCGSKDLTADNDIILCDGACERGFHQYCLEPPLHAEDIPPADQGWLCPGCDCKVDCMDLLNESQGTNLSITDSWEKVFPEVATAENAEDPNLGLPSDDSDDADYDPGAPQVDEDQGDGSSSDESGSNIASDKLGAPLKDDCMGLPSDDSEDDDFDPDAPDHEKVNKEESSSSDFTSDSEDLAAAVGSVVDEVNSCRDGGRRSSKNSFEKKEIVKCELQSLLEGDADKDVSMCMPEKRHVERLDYKKLYDEEFGDRSSDSSDDEEFVLVESDEEDWSDTVASRKRKRGADEDALASKNGNFTSGENIKHKKNGNKLTPRRRTGNRMDSPNTTNIIATPHKCSSTPGSTGGRARSTYRRLGEVVTQRLHEAFKENQYPERAASEKLAEELGITTQQVKKWFENARWSFNHPSGSKVRVSAKDIKMDRPVQQPCTGPCDSSLEVITNDAPTSGISNAEPSGVVSMPECIDKGVKAGDVGCPQMDRKTYKSSHLGKTEDKADDMVSGSDLSNQSQAIEDDLAKASEPQTSSRRQTRSKSNA